ELAICSRFQGRCVMDKQASKETKLNRFLKAPIRVLIKARDLYVQSITQCAGRVEYGGVMGGPAVQVSSSLPKSFSVNSSKPRQDDDFRELIRAASVRGLSNRVQLELLRQQKSPAAATGVDVVPRSMSVGIGRIDEDKPCEFEEDDFKVNPAALPRSKSYAVSTRAYL
ncbi:hypothetical protein U1Q18_011981, partial [Sarracenia purpurea var. burkii]